MLKATLVALIATVGFLAVPASASAETESGYASVNGLDAAAAGRWSCCTAR